MKLLIDKSKLYTNRGKTLVPLQCERCDKIFHRENRFIKRELKVKHNRYRYCGTNCAILNSIKKINIECANCNKNVIRQLKEYKKSKSGNSFCNHSCAAIFNNKNKTTGTRRSKLEEWIENKLNAEFHNLEIQYNQIINECELDIYIPSLNLAFELNGVFHYKPIYGRKKLNKIRMNDYRKLEMCLSNGINLVVIDASKQKYFSEKSSVKYWEIVKFYMMLAGKV